MANPDVRQRIDVLRELLADGKLSTQEELVEELNRQNFSVTQSTISRDLRRIGAVKAVGESGMTVYKLGDRTTVPTGVASGSLKNLVINIQHNDSMIVIHTAIGSASMVANHLDHVKPAGILGTIAGDDTIFVAAGTSPKISEIIKNIYGSL